MTNKNTFMQAVAYATSSGAGGLTLKSLAVKATELLQMAVVVIIGAVFLFVAWTLINTWIRQGASEEARKKGRNTLVAGIVGLVVLVSLWGIVGFLRDGLFF